MLTDAHIILLCSELFHKTVALVLLKNTKKYFEVMKNVKTLKFEGNWGEL